MNTITCECPICLEPFDVPRGLPCLHVFCTSCLQWHINNNIVGGSFACPMCRAITTLPDTSLDSSTWSATFPIANVVCELMETLRIQNETNKSAANDCELCLHQNTDTAALCKTCKLNLCYDCSETHSIGSPTHKILLDKAIFKSRQESDYPICPTHINETLDLFCVKCDSFICLKCTFGKHASCSQKPGENVKTIDVLAEEMMTSDQIQLGKLENECDQMGRLLNDIEIAKGNLLISKEENDSRIDKIVDAMIASLENKRTQGKASLKRVFDTRLKNLSKTSYITQKRLNGLNHRISGLQTILKIENKYDYICESKETVTEVAISLDTNFSVKSGLCFSMNPEFHLIFDKMGPIDIGNAFIAKDADCEKTPWCKFDTTQNFVVNVYSGDIITTKVDGIVNPTDSQLRHSGELSRNIILAAGPTISAAREKVLKSHGKVDQLSLSDVCITEAGKLDFRFILHAVVPTREQLIIRCKEKQSLEQLICQTVSNSLFVANSLKLKSLALPLFCFSADSANSCARGYFQGILDFSNNHCTNSTNNLREVHFVDSNLHAIHYIQALFKKYLRIIYSVSV